MSEVCAVVDVSQFAPGHSTDKCGFYAVSLLRSAGQSRPSASPGDVAAWADAEYVTYDGGDVYTNENGMTMAGLQAVLHDAGLHYQVVGSTELGFHTDRIDADHVRAWLAIGYPVILAIWESNVIDLDPEINGIPYSWPTAGLSHIIVATGVDGTALLCHDTASIGDNGVRPGPRRYDAGTLMQGALSATAVVLPWLRRPPDDYDAYTEGATFMTIPTGWSDDGTTLKDPQGHALTGAVRTTIMAEVAAGRWNSDNVLIGTIRFDQDGESVLLEDGRWKKGDELFFGGTDGKAIAVAWSPDPAVTSGTQQTNVTIVVPTSTELYWARKAILDLQRQIAALTAQLHQAQQPSTANAIGAADAIIAAADAIKADLGASSS